MSERYTQTFQGIFDNKESRHIDIPNVSDVLNDRDRIAAEVETLREAYKTLRMFIWSHWEIAYEDARQANVENDKDAEAKAMVKANLYNAIMCHPASRELDIYCGLLKPIAIASKEPTTNS